MANLPFVKARMYKVSSALRLALPSFYLLPNSGALRMYNGYDITEVGSQIPDHVHDESEEVCSSSAGKLG